MYKFMERTRQLFGLLEDDLSREIFKARTIMDVEPSMSNAMRLVCLDEEIWKKPEEAARRMTWRETLESLNRAGKKILLYGAGAVGFETAVSLQNEKIDFYGFCDRQAAALAGG